MTTRSGKVCVLALTMIAALAMSATIATAAPKGTAKPKPAAQDAVLQGLFDQTRFEGVEGAVDEQGGVSYTIPISKNLSVTIQELTTGYAWVWCAVGGFESAPPARLFRTMAELNDASRWGNLSFAKNQQGPGGTVYLNYFFLMRTADAEAVEEYVDICAGEHDRLVEALSEYLP